MKKTALLFLLTIALSGAEAQNEPKAFQSFKLDVAFGYGRPVAPHMTSSGIFAIEPKYALNNYITLGLRLVDVSGISPIDAPGFFNIMSSFEFTTDYFFTANRVRPFVGLGAGAFWVPTSSPSTSNLYTATSFGVTPRGGIEVGRIRAAVELNLIGKTQDLNYTYAAIKTGFFLWGSRIDDY